MPHPYLSSDLRITAGSDCIVCVDSHTRFSGSQTVRIPMGTRVTIETAPDGTKWYTWGETEPNEFGYPQHLYRGKLIRYDKPTPVSNTPGITSSQRNREREGVDQCERHGDREDLHGVVLI